MKKNIKYAFILLAICAVSSFALGFTNSITEPVIIQQDIDNKNKALQAVSNGWEIGEQKDVKDETFVTYYIPLSDQSKVAGYILGLKTSGYGGEMILAASYSTEGEMLFAQMLTNSETPGLGKKAEMPGYMNKFKGTGGNNKQVPTSKDMLDSADAAAVSGSSVTFGGVAKAIKGGSEYVKTLGGAK